jgi:RsiW-degrading membrane proteinase PrsW (M82 family)
MSIQTLLLILVFGAAIGIGFAVFYQRGFAAGVKQAEQGSIRLSTENLTTIHWLAVNGFQRLLLLGLRERGYGFQSRETAEKADWALGHLEHYLPKDEMKPDYRWDK